MAKKENTKKENKNAQYTEKELLARRKAMYKALAIMSIIGTVLIAVAAIIQFT